MGGSQTPDLLNDSPPGWPGQPLPAPWQLLLAVGLFYLVAAFDQERPLKRSIYAYKKRDSRLNPLPRYSEILVAVLIPMSISSYRS